jgi:hypothetical protein
MALKFNLRAVAISCNNQCEDVVSKVFVTDSCTVRSEQRHYGTWTVFQKNYEILGGKVRNIISKTLFLCNFTAGGKQS